MINLTITVVNWLVLSPDNTGDASCDKVNYDYCAEGIEKDCCEGTFPEVFH